MHTDPSALDRPPSDDGPTPGGDPVADDAWAKGAFAVALAAGFVLILYLGRDMWFKGDEWYFLADRDAGDLGDLFRPHNLVHWTTLPVLFYRAVYRAFGLHSYLAYQVPLVLLHVGIAWQLRRIMLRSRADPWIATAAATAFLLFGSGFPNMIWAFQISLNGSLFLGLTHLLLATHDGPLDRRDGLGLLAGALGLLCSGVAVTMVIIVGLAVLLRRGVRPALIHTVPLATIYLIWWFGYARSDEADALERGSPDQWVEFVWIGMKSTFAELGQLPLVGLGLAVMLVVGMLLAWEPRRHLRPPAALAAPLAMLAGAVVFLFITALGRVASALGALDLVLGPEAGASPRYLYMVAALILPALAVAATASSRGRPMVLVAACLVFLVGIPGNIDALANPDGLSFDDDVIAFNRNLVLSFPRSPVA
ncbi:MAG: hypothetical protein OEW42_02270, partial [Acidimicrobiia bacterium]|nr:hypothetical protein [Acidimicrobiia bacterium]